MRIFYQNKGVLSRAFSNLILTAPGKVKMKNKENGVFSVVMSFMPDSVRLEIERLGVRPDEIRLRAYGVCAVVARGRNLALSARVCQEDMRRILKSVCDMAVYAHRDDICRGYVAIAGGGRVGVVGHAKYEGGRLCGISDVISLIFRIPSGECSFGPSLYREWQKKRSGMLICSPAGCGKTTAIRYLAGKIGGGESPMRVAVVDERCEFDLSSYSGAMVDVLRGYRRAVGVEIAIRTISAEVLIVDEIGTREDSDALLGAVGAGVTVIATAHGRGAEEARKRECIKTLCDAGLFDTYAVISRENGQFFLNVSDT